MKILLAYDASPAADTAVEETLKRPWPAGTEVRLVTVVQPPIVPAAPPGFEADLAVIERLHTEWRDQATQLLHAAAARLRGRSDLHVESEVRDGSPKASLLAAIEEWRPDLVVAGSHGERGLGRLLLGSVCHALVTHAACSVEVVKKPPGAHV